MEKRNSTRKILVMMAITMSLGISACGEKEKPLSIEEKIKKQAQEAVKNDLKDPESAQFRNIVITKPELDPDLRIGMTRKVCGEVNAKNSLGGYTGHKPFIVFTSTKDTQIKIGGVFIDELAIAMGFEKYCFN